MESPVQRFLPAVCLAQQGCYIIPLHHATAPTQCSCQNLNCTSVAKHPLLKNGLKDASNNPDTISFWWRKWPHANLAIVTGELSSLVVIDIDPRHGGDTSLLKLGAIPKTLRVKSGGGGQHLYFRYPKTGTLLGRINWLPGIDVKSDGGYIVAPPSNHASGNYYEWVGEWSDIAELPIEWVESINKKKESATVSTTDGGKIPEGQRNSFLTSLAGFLKFKGISDVAHVLNAVNACNTQLCEPTLDSKEIEKIVFSVSKHGDTWDEPKSLPERSTIVPTMDDTFIPEVLKPWVCDIVERMQVPVEFIAIPAIVSISACIGRSACIRPKRLDDWSVVPNLWGALIARPGFFKTPCISEALKPLQHLAKLAFQEFQKESLLANCDEEVIKAQIDGITERMRLAAKKGDFDSIFPLKAKFVELQKEKGKIGAREKRFLTNDTTVEKLGLLLNENPKGMLLVRDELSGWMRSLDKYGREGDREFYLEAWNGSNPFSIDRVGRGTLHVEGLCLSILGGLQPGKLKEYASSCMNGGVEDDGMLQRFQLIVYPETSKTWKNIDRQPDESAFQSVRGIFENLLKLRSREEQKTFRFSDTAQEMFDVWREELELTLRSGTIPSNSLESHFAKYRKLVPALALVFHAVTDLVEDQVSEKNLQLAIKWSKFLEKHAYKVYATPQQHEAAAAKFLGSKILSGEVRDADTVRNIRRRAWPQLSEQETLNSALSTLEDLGWIRLETVKKSRGRGSEIILVNPRLLKDSNSVPH